MYANSDYFALRREMDRSEKRTRSKDHDAEQGVTVPNQPLAAAGNLERKKKNGTESITVWAQVSLTGETLSSLRPFTKSGGHVFPGLWLLLFFLAHVCILCRY